MAVGYFLLIVHIWSAKLVCFICVLFSLNFNFLQLDLSQKNCFCRPLLNKKMKFENLGGR